MILQQGVKKTQAAVLPLVGGGARVKDKVSGREQGRLLPGEGLQIGGQALGLGVVGAEENQRPPQIPTQTRCQKGAAGPGETGGRHGGGAAVQGGEEALVFGQSPEQFGQSFHTYSLSASKEL